MADSLDDFFAKKDKKRSKDKGKAALSAEVLVRELEEGSKPVEQVSRKESKTSAAMELLGLAADDADWRDFEEVEKRDYSGLKVKEMSLQDQNEEEQRRLISEQAETAPESSAWRIKGEDTSAPAAAAAATDATAPTNAKPAAAVAAAAVAAAAAASLDTVDKPVAGSDATAAPTTAATAVAGATASATPAAAEGAAPAADQAKPADQKEEAPKAGDKESAKPPKKYVPPGGRGENGEMRVLEPMRLSRLRGANSHYGSSIPNIQDEQAFPSLG